MQSTDRGMKGLISVAALFTPLRFNYEGSPPSSRSWNQGFLSTLSAQSLARCIILRLDSSLLSLSLRRLYQIPAHISIARPIFRGW